MRLNIDIEKSIEEKRLVPISWYFKILDYFNVTFFASVFIISIIGPTIGAPIKIDSTDIFLIALVIVVYTIVVFALNKMDRLSFVDIHNSRFDMNFFKSLAKENKWSIIKESDNILLFNATHLFLHERQVTIIKNNNFIFINVMSFGKYDIKSPIYFRKDKEIRAQIIEKINNNAT